MSSTRASGLQIRIVLITSLVGAPGCPLQGDLGSYTDSHPGSGSGSGTDTTPVTATMSTSLTGDEQPLTTTANGPTGTSEGSTADSETAETTAATATTSLGETTAVETGETGETESTGGPDPVCADGEPGPEDYARVLFDVWPEIVGNEQKFTGVCTVVEVTQPDLFEISLDCGDRTAIVEVAVAPVEFTLSLQPGQALQLDWLARGGSFWTNQWLALRDETLDPPLLLAAHEADTALPAGLPEFLAPISISFDGDSCGVPVDCHDNDSYERLLLEFVEAGDVVLVPDRTRADVGDYRVIVNYARRYHDLHQMANDCPNPTDPVLLYFQGLALRREN